MRPPFVPVLALVVLVLMGGCGAPSGEPASAATGAPAGMRWVGWGQVVVAVPDWWTTGETHCFAPVEDTVYFDTAATADCSDAPATAAVQEVSALALLDADSGYGELVVRDMEPIGEVSGDEVLEREGCERWFEGVCRRLFAVPSQGVVLVVTIAEEGDGDYTKIRDSLRILPDDLTTVPLATRDGVTPAWGAEPEVSDDLVDQLNAAGLDVEIKTLERSEDDDGTTDYASFPKGTLLDVSPPLGSVIDVGGTVTVTLSGQSLEPSS
jgi:hypothetical protein